MSASVLETLRSSRDAKASQLDEILKPGGEVRQSELTDEEFTRSGGLLADLAALDERIEDLGQLEARDAARAAAARERGQGETPVESVRVTSEPQVSTRESGNQWINDAYRSRFCDDQNARDRLNRYARENEVLKRDLGTTAFGGLIPPQYLLDQYAELMRAGRPIANAVTRLPLDDIGMTLTIPRGTTGTTTDVQTAENTDIAEADYDETDLTIPVITVAGQTDVSRQSLERGRGTDTILFADLAADFGVKVDREVIAGTGVGGHSVGIFSTGGINAITYTDATPTVPEFWPKIADAIQQVNTGRIMPATAIGMHPRRWGWITSLVDSTGRPVFGVVNSGPVQNVIGVGDAAKYGQVVGYIQGLPVITDANLATNLGAGTNEDIVAVFRAPDCLLWEQNGGVPRELRFEQTNASKLMVKLAVYGYMAFSAGRYPAGISKISGTGLIAPTF